jgi:hypothetical protein
MAIISLCEIVGGKVANIALADDQNIPAHMSGWTVSDGTAVVGGTFDGVNFGPKTQADIDAEQDAELEALVDQVLQVNRVVRAVAMATFEIYDRASAAGIAGFPALTDAQKRQFIKDRL